MANKQTVFNQSFSNPMALNDALSLLERISSSQASVIALMARGLLPGSVRIDQRVPKGTLDVFVAGEKGARAFKLSPRAKVREVFGGE